ERMLDSDGNIQGRIVALDMLPMVPIEGVTFIQGDFREDAVLGELEKMLGTEPVDLVISDMAPNLSGIKAADTARMQHVHELALEFSSQRLKPDGALIVKAFHGSGFTQTVELFRQYFDRVTIRKPKASRDK